MRERRCDLLVLGAGLAGLRAAWAALDARPEARVLLVSARLGPTGSSFANRNDRLGMQVLSDDASRESFVQEALRLAAPGVADPGLVRLLAGEGEERFRELLDLGVPFLREPSGELKLHSACFSPKSRHCVVMHGLAGVHERLQARLDDLGVERLTDVLVRDLLQDSQSSRVVGAVVQAPGDPPERLAIAAGAVVLAMGGPAPLFAWNLAGPGNPGYSLALARRAGARLINIGYCQFLWCGPPDMNFVPIGRVLGADGWRLRTDGRLAPLPATLRELAPERNGHCPVGHGLPDSALDRFLLRGQNDGLVEVGSPNGSTRRIMLMAQAHNGGALVDEQARTSVPGLFACGECASGMHGANRLGGAMVLATQVFGRRAGQSAVLEAWAPDSRALARAIERFESRNPPEGRNQAERERNARDSGALRTWLGRTLQRSILCEDEERRRLSREIERALRGKDNEDGRGRVETPDWFSRLLLESGRLLLAGSDEHFETTPRRAVIPDIDNSVKPAD